MLPWLICNIFVDKWSVGTGSWWADCTGSWWVNCTGSWWVNCTGSWCDCTGRWWSTCGEDGDDVWMGCLLVDFKVRDCKADFWDLSSDVGFNFLEQLESEMKKKHFSWENSTYN